MTRDLRAVNIRKIGKMEYLTFRNALRLHLDSIKLFRSGSYPSSFFLSVLALEEFGKAWLLGDFVFYWGRDVKMEPKDERGWLDMIYYHRVKQGAFHRNAALELPKPFALAISNGRLDRLKQESVYVGFEKRGKIKGRLRTPFSVTRKKAVRQITIVNDYLRVFSLGVSRQVYGWDNPMVVRHLNKGLFNRFSALWKVESGAARRLLRKLRNV
jgi:AbiV family abortive infection protein